ncbi:MAG: hypothetical protein ABI919_03985 [Ramlibacter sp.]
MNQPSFEDAVAQLDAWKKAHAELVLLEKALSDAMTEYARTLGESPRHWIIAAERKREEVGRLFDAAIEALDTHSTAKTGHTNFGNLP